MSEKETATMPARRQGVSRPGTAQRVLEDAVLELLEEEHEATDDLPTSIRFLFYELEQRGHVSKQVAGRKRRSDTYVSEALMRLREEGIIPWDWIHDDTRSLHQWYSSPSVLDYVEEAIGRARINPWQGVRRPVIITESRTTAGVLERGLAPRYVVAIAATNGQCGGFVATHLAPQLTDEETQVLYIGDLDDCGTDIEDNTRRAIERHAERRFDEETWRRIAITGQQADWLRGRGVEPIIKKDKRYKDGRTHYAFECEALGQGRLTGLIRSALDQLLPEPLDDVLEREREERSEIRGKLGLDDDDE